MHMKGKNYVNTKGKTNKKLASMRLTPLAFFTVRRGTLYSAGYGYTSAVAPRLQCVVFHPKGDKAGFREHRLWIWTLGNTSKQLPLQLTALANKLPTYLHNNGFHSPIFISWNRWREGHVPCKPCHKRLQRQTAHPSVSGHSPIKHQSRRRLKPLLLSSSITKAGIEFRSDVAW